MKITIYTIGVFMLVFLAVKVEAQIASKPNVIIILADDLGYADVSYNGGDIKTPNIDQLASNGLILNRFYAHITCTPSRVGLMSGRFAAREGLAHGVITPKCGDGLNPDLYILPEMLRDAGYTNRSCIGKWHLGHSDIKYHPINQGFTHFYGHYGGMIDYFSHRRAGEVDWHRDYDFCADKGYATDLITNEAVKQIKDWAKVDAPFFIYVAYNAPHTPLQAKAKYLKDEGFEPKKGTFELANDSLRKFEAEGRGNDKRQTYKAMVKSLDEGVGEIMDALKSNGIIDNTLVLFYSDNGGYEPNGADNGPLRGGKGTFYEGGVRVPAVIHYPKLVKVGAKSEQMISHIDLFPTLMTLAKANENKLFMPLDGVDMSSLMKNLNERDKLNYGRILYLGRRALVSQRWKLVNNELFDIEQDNSETTNIAEIYPIIYQSLLERLEQLKTEVDHPIERNFNYKIKKNWEMPR